MTRALGFAALGTLFTFSMTALGAAAVFVLGRETRRGTQETLLGFAGGVMTAAAVWSLLLPAVERAREGPLPAWLPAAAGAAAGAALLSAAGALLPHALGGFDPLRRRDTMLLFAITLHNIPEGMAVGLAFALAADGEGLAGAAALALGVGVQNFPEGAAVSLPLRQAGDSRLRAFALGALSGAVEPVFGTAAVLAAALVRPLMPWLLGFAAGAMLGVTLEELTPQRGDRAGSAGFLAGFLVMMALDTALG